jgi:hypothetical protein
MASSAGPSASCSDEIVITGNAPKFYRVRFSAGSLRLPEPAASLFAGAGLQLASVTLQYDPVRSTPLQAVWSATSNPVEPAWMLSVTKCGAELSAILTLSRPAGPLIQAPLAWGSRCFAFGSGQSLAWCNIPKGLLLPAAIVEPVKA